MKPVDVKSDTFKITEWKSVEASPATCYYRQNGNQFEVRYSVALRKEVNYAMPNFLQIIPGITNLTIIEQLEAITWSTYQVGNRRVKGHVLSKQLILKQVPS